MKKILVLTFAAVCMLPAAATAFQCAVMAPAGVTVLSKDVGELMPDEGAVGDEDLIQISGQSYQGLLPWGGLVPEMETVTKIKLWDEPDRLPSVIEISRAPGIIQSRLPLMAVKP